MRPVAAALCAVVAALACAAPAAAKSKVRVTEGVVYDQARVGAPQRGAADLLLDLYEPVSASRAKRPVVVLIHGGGFQNGSRSQAALVRIATALAERGTVVASIDYRLQPQQPVPSARVARLERAAADVPIFTAMVAAVDDTLSATDWLKRRERRLRIDMDRLGVVGGSAGAITADHVAYVLDDVGVRGPKVRWVGNLWGGVFLPGTASLEATARQLERREAALFTVHGVADRTVPVELGDALFDRARAVDVPAEYIRIPRAGHGFEGTGFFTREVRSGQTSFQRLLRFAARWSR